MSGGACAVPGVGGSWRCSVGSDDAHCVAHYGARACAAPWEMNAWSQSREVEMERAPPCLVSEGINSLVGGSHLFVL